MPENLAPKAKASATSEHNQLYLAKFATDGKIPPAGSRAGSSRKANQHRRFLRPTTLPRWPMWKDGCFFTKNLPTNNRVHLLGISPETNFVKFFSEWSNDMPPSRRAPPY